MIKYCEKLVKKNGSLVPCDRPLDQYGNCHNKSKHVREGQF